MKSVRFLAVAFLMLLLAALANAQATRTWISGVGDDANPCSRTAPCKTFAGAISKTATGGEIDCLDPGGFGALTITKSITLDCNSGVGSILVSGTPGITINAAGAIVLLHNLDIQGIGSGTDGIHIAAAATVFLDNVVIMNFAGSGVNVNASASTNVVGRNVRISNCLFGLSVATSAGNAIADFASSQFSGNSVGVIGQASSLITIKDSVISLNAAQGVTQSIGGSQINLITSQLSSNATAVLGTSGSVIRIVGNAFTQNGTAINTNGGSVLSDGTNTNLGNGIVGSPGSLPGPIKI
jgi:hypothetical protein